MLLDLKPLLLTIPGRSISVVGAILAAGVVGAGLFLGSLASFSQSQNSQVAEMNLVDPTSPKVISSHFLSLYQIPFQVAGLLILGAVMGAIVLGKPKRASASMGAKN